MRVLRVINIMAIVVGIAAVCMTGIRTNASVWGEKNPDKFLESADGVETLIVTDDVYQDYFADDITCYDELAWSSSFIIRAEITDARVMNLTSTETTVTVKEVIKDDEGVLTPGMEIYYIEPCSFLAGIYFMSSGYNYVQAGEEYILFLNRLVCPEGYDYTDREALSFMPSSQLFSRYCLTKTETAEVLSYSDDEPEQYAQYRNYAMFTDDEEKVRVYNEIYNFLTK